MKGYKFFLVVFIIILGLPGCADKEEIIAPTHFNRVPIPVNLAFVSDTTALGTKYVLLSWSVNDATNLKSFEVLRSKNQIATFQSKEITENKSITDSSFNSNDSLVYYYVISNGKDRFISQHSDTIKVILK